MNTLKIRFMMLVLEYMMYWGTDHSRLSTLNFPVHKSFVDRVKALHSAMEMKLQEENTPITEEKKQE